MSTDVFRLRLGDIGDIVNILNERSMAMNMLEFSVTQNEDASWTIHATVDQTSTDGLGLATDVARHLRRFASRIRFDYGNLVPFRAAHDHAHIHRRHSEERDDKARQRNLLRIDQLVNGVRTPLER